MTGHERSPRERIVYSAAQLVRARGVNATGVRDVVEAADAPRGSFQHYFPGGKDQLMGEAVLWSGKFAADVVRGYAQTARRRSAAGLFEHMAAQWTKEFDERGFERGCPLMATAAEVIGTDSPLNPDVRTALDEWLGAVEAELVAMSLTRARARRLASLMISALEGAILQARILQDTGPLTTVVHELRPVLAVEPALRG